MNTAQHRLGSILVIDNDADNVRRLRKDLTREGYSVSAQPSFEKSRNILSDPELDLIIMDLVLPGTDGFLALSEIHAGLPSVPIIILSEKNSELHKVTALKRGADDYVIKPYGNRELLARLETILRRQWRLKLKQSIPHMISYEIGNALVDFRVGEVVRGRAHFSLGHYEGEILKILINSKAEPVTRDRLHDEVWGYRFLPETRSIDNHIAKLRRKVESDPARPEHILTVRGVGYMFQD
ncbi:MAG: response regulator transcription factor [Planctomycetota bacterium]|nr:response regulator transcription factor [Planctomycetota bacterium]